MSLSVCCAVVAQSVIIGSAEGGWRYPYVEHDALITFKLDCGLRLVAAGAVALLLIPCASVGRSAVVAPARLDHPGDGLQWPLRSMAPSSLETVFVSDNANSFYSVTRRHEPTDVLRYFNRVRANAPLHVQSNMPGKLMLLYALQLVSTRTDVLPWLVIGLEPGRDPRVPVRSRSLRRQPDRVRRGRAYLLCRPAIFLPASEHGDPDRHSDLWMAAGAMVADWRDRLRADDGARCRTVFFEPLPLVMGCSLRPWCSPPLDGARWRGPFPRPRRASRFRLHRNSEAVAAASGFDAVRAFRSIGTHAVEFNESTGRPYWVGPRQPLGVRIWHRVLSGDELRVLVWSA